MDETSQRTKPQETHSKLRVAGRVSDPGARPAHEFSGLTPEDLPRLQARVRQLAELPISPESRAKLIDLLDTVRRRAFVSRLEPHLVQAWTDLILLVIERARYRMSELLASRERTDPDTVAFRLLDPEPAELTVAEVARRSRAIARGLVSALGDDPEASVAILSGNCIECALSDIACLANGIRNVRLPANAVPQQVEFMLRHSRARLLLVSDDEQLEKVRAAQNQLPDLRGIIALSKETAARHRLPSLEQLVAEGADLDDALLDVRASRVEMGDPATVMYTSGTTGTPKGIVFTQRNIITKRFCRGFALRDVGEEDVFLAYLPLFHTFGRWFELIGTLYWGATYVFARDPSISTLLQDFASVRPTAFLSVPKKWMEIHELALREARGDDPQAQADVIRTLTGGRLRFGLSAAGFLDPEVFRSVQRAGVDLCSGYGATEATGGVTMTPPRGYREGSIGLPLPGVELRIDPDGELLIRGPYVMAGYLAPEDGNRGIDPEGWFRTGDIVRRDADGFLWIIDRKKEIYKNRNGQTIAPQRVENLFRDFDVISQAFLVGDRRDYNTLLIWPNYEAHPELELMGAEELRDLIASLVASANRFLAPYERVVAFQILPRALSEASGELTPKGTFKRQDVEAKWSDLIEPMYLERGFEVRLAGVTVRVPTWLLRAIGVVRNEVSWSDGRLSIRGRSVTLLPAAEGRVRLGDFEYAPEGGVLDVGAILSSPILWTGNEELRAFLGTEAFSLIASRRREPARAVQVVPGWHPPADSLSAQMLALVEGRDVTAASLHAAAVLLRAPGTESVRAVDHLQEAVSHRHPDVASLARALLLRAAGCERTEVRRRASLALIASDRTLDVASTLGAFFEKGAALFREDDLQRLCERGLAEAQVHALIRELSRRSDNASTPAATSADRSAAVGLMRLLAAYAVAHPVWYSRVRLALARLFLHKDAEIAARAGEELDRLQLGFRAWIGPNLRLAVDPDTGREYSWTDVTRFGPSVELPHRESLLRCISETSMVRESVFLFGRGQLLSLADLSPDSLIVHLLGTNHGKSVYRVSVQTRAHAQFDFALNVAETLPVQQLREEIRWLLAAGAPPRLVEDFGGYFPEYGMFTEEFIPGETVDRQLDRLVDIGAIERLRNLWPYLAWTSCQVHVDFWERSSRRLAVEPALANIIVPSHDYQVGARLVSITRRIACTSVGELLSSFVQLFVRAAELRHPELRGALSPVVLFSAVIEVVGEEKGVSLLSGIEDRELRDAGASFVEALRTRGFTPQRLYFAIQRYARWIAVNPGATLEARGIMLRQLWDTYGLEETERTHPDARIRFFRRTVFRDARVEVADALESLMKKAREGKLLEHEGMSEQIAELREQIRPSDEEDWFLARMAFRHLQPEEEASLILLSSGDRHVTDVMVAMADADGNRFRVRAPVSPREVARLLNLFHDANLQVSFSAEHEFLIALDQVDRVIGGLYFRSSGDRRVHLEKIVVGRQHRRKGVSDGLMQDFMRRLRSRGVVAVETGYFRPEYMQRFGFRMEPHTGGMFRELSVPLDRPPSNLPPRPATPR